MTFSVCVRAETPEGPAFGVGVATDAPAVGALAPYVSHRGAVSTQSFVNVRLGRRGIALLDDIGVEDALPGLLARDEDSDLRQLHGVDADGGAFAFTGDGCEEWSGDLVRRDAGVTAAGNMLANGETLDAAADAFLDGAEAASNDPVPDADLVPRLLDALDAGRDGGGDKRGHSSAAVAVKAPKTTAYHDLRVDEHGDPLAELRRVYEAAEAASGEFTEEKKSRIFD
ncbi:DUF1028 domain-containing protein [Halobaculum gomorrense]|uniref:Uncharacterized conserved protein, Ntn-hydrolase superfamily n=1 Tax=Halobaculum gomorrense TaxID=43928 RepID=A0A1M5M522_9EURY|nr:DUF1028 domain-containing protein [Halobaculum gomorrense]SHG72348.1 Uncharacterized conserved protein, Ntn-hydrolase superfamily [Halobaculum gomorrense]